MAINPVAYLDPADFSLIQRGTTAKKGGGKFQGHRNPQEFILIATTRYMYSREKVPNIIYITLEYSKLRQHLFLVTEEFI